MNRYDYYTRCANFDEQEWLTEALYYPEQEDDIGRDRYTPSYDDEYDVYDDYDDDFYSLYDDDEDDLEYAYDDDDDDPEYAYDDDEEGGEPA